METKTKFDWKRLLAPEEETYRYDCLLNLRWNGKPVCPHCKNSDKIYSYTKRRLFRCAKCDKQFSVTSGTILHSSKLPLLTVFKALEHFSLSKNGVSSYLMGEMRDVSQPTAWKLQHKIRMGMANSQHFKGKLLNNVELDEAYIGGKNKNRHWDKKVKGNQGRATIDKIVVFGMLDRTTGKLFVWPLAKLRGEGLQALCRSKIEKGANVYTDEFPGYNGLNKTFNHEIVVHGKGNYVNGNASTNTLEGFWSLLKRALMGTYRGKVRKAYLERYCKEVAYRYVTRHYNKYQRMEEILETCLLGRYTKRGLYL